MEPEANEEAQEEQLDFTHPAYVFLPPGNHEYRQQGTYLVCKSCEIQHAVFVGIDRLMVGVDEKGTPILRTRHELGM